MSSTIGKIKQKFKKPNLSFLAIWNMNVGFFGIQYSFGLQQTNMSPIYKYLGAHESELALLWLAGPITGLLVQPIIGAMSDGTWSPRFGRRKPYFLVGAIMASIALFLMPYSSAVWMAASLLWMLDAGNNIAMEPYRAFISDKLNKGQHSVGFLMQSFFTGFGAVLANLTPTILVFFGAFLVTDKMENGIPVSTYWAFIIGGFASIATVVYSVMTTPEYPPTEEELAEIQKIKGFKNTIEHLIADLVWAFKNMPLTMKQLIPVKFFSWFGMFSYWVYITSALSLSLYGTTDETSEFYNLAQLLTGQVNGTYTFVCMVASILLIPVAKSIGPIKVHFGALTISGISILTIPYIGIDDTLFGVIPLIYLPFVGLGISWASMLSMPYVILASAIPPEKNGVYMGIFNMFIVIPQMLFLFSSSFFLFEFLGENPINMIRLVGVCLLLAALATMLIKDNDAMRESVKGGGGGGH